MYITGDAGRFQIDAGEDETPYSHLPKARNAMKFYEGYTYVFNISSSTLLVHNFSFSTTSDGTHAGGSAYTTGVTTGGGKILLPNDTLFNYQLDQIRFTDAGGTTYYSGQLLGLNTNDVIPKPNGGSIASNNTNNSNDKIIFIESLNIIIFIKSILICL